MNESKTNSSCSLDSLSSDLEKSGLIALIRAAESAERYNEMRMFMNEDLTKDELDLFSVACKNAINPLRASWRSLCNEVNSNIDKDLLKKYILVIEGELEDICNEALECTAYLKNFIKSAESAVFYLKMRGDCYRYLSELLKEKDTLKEKANECYNKSREIADAYMKKTDSMRLGMALSTSVYHYEILKEPKKAYDIAKKAFDAAMEELDTLNEESCEDATVIMQLLRKNMELWANDHESNE